MHDELGDRVVCGVIVCVRVAEERVQRAVGPLAAVDAASRAAPLLVDNAADPRAEGEGEVKLKVGRVGVVGILVVARVDFELFERLRSEVGAVERHFDDGVAVSAVSAVVDAIGVDAVRVHVWRLVVQVVEVV